MSLLSTSSVARLLAVACAITIGTITIGAASLGCGRAGSPEAAGPSSAHVRLAAFSSLTDSERLLHFEDPTGTRYTLTSARVVVERAAFELPAGVACDDLEADLSAPVGCADGRVLLDGPFVVELRGGRAIPAMAEASVPALDYRAVDLEVRQGGSSADPLDAKDELVDRTVAAHATFLFENAPRRLRLLFGFHRRMHARIDEPIAAGQTVALRMDVSRWLHRIPVTTCVMRGHIFADDDVVTVNGNPFSGDCAEADVEFPINFEESLRVDVVEKAGAE